jgi:zinc/manganese transport system substrate-binding protein
MLRDPREDGVTSPSRRLGAALLGVAALAVVVTACGGASTAPKGGAIAVVAAENFWGSIVGQLGGSHVTVTSVVTDPNADPHDYQSNPSTARAFATARYVVVNGAGYDSWAANLLDANHSSDRTVFTVADLLGRKEGDNPHFWYSPDYVGKVAGRITSDLSTIDPGDAAYFTQQRAAFETALQPYHDRIAAIRQRFSGRTVASTESIFQYMAVALGLNVISPPEFMKAVSEGNDPPAGTITTFQQQLQTKAASILVYNRQTATDVTTNLQRLAAQQGIPVVGLSETVQPPDATFQQWMVSELNDLQNALNASGSTQ